MAIHAAGSDKEHWAILFHPRDRHLIGSYYDATTLGKPRKTLNFRMSPIDQVVRSVELWTFIKVGEAKEEGERDFTIEITTALQSAHEQTFKEAPPAQNCVDFVMLGLETLAKQKMLSAKDVEAFKAKYPHSRIEEIRIKTGSMFKQGTCGAKPSAKPATGKWEEVS